MNYSQELLNELQQKTGWSLNKIAKELGKSQPYISKVAKGDTKISNDLALEIGEYLGLDSNQVLTRNSADKAQTAKEKKAWGKLLIATAASTMAISVTAKAAIDNCVQCILC